MFFGLSTLYKNLLLWLAGTVSTLLRNAFGEQKVTSLYLNSINNITDTETRKHVYLSELNNLIEAEERFLIPDFKAGFGKEKDRYSYQKQYVNFGIKDGEKVLDIGSGDIPFPQATHLADLYEGETSHRAKPIVKDARPFEICDIENLPYRDTEFDFVYCSHILEHVKDPARACNEIMRVGKRGYIETPTRMSDIMMNFTKLHDHHKWHINLLGKTLVFQEWTDNERKDTGCNDFFKMFISRYKNPFQTLFYDNADLFTNMLLWDNKFYYYVFDKNGKLVASNREHV